MISIKTKGYLIYFATNYSYQSYNRQTWKMLLEFNWHDSLQFTLILKRNVLVYLNLQQKMQRRDHASCFV